MTHDELKEKVKMLPFAPGIYMMKDKNGKIIYVGKSKCLHNRVSHYFQPISNLTPKTARLSMNIFDFECINTILCKFLWFYCSSGKYCSTKSGRLCL